MLILKSPTELRLQGYNHKLDAVSKELTYTDKKVDWALKKFKAGRGWFVTKFGQTAFDARLAELQAERQKSILFQDEDGMYTYSGVHPLLSKTFGDEIKREYDLPEPKLVSWAKEPENKARYYQTEMVEKLLEAAPNGPAGVEVGTGLGKSHALEMLLKRLGLKSLVMAPSVNIAEQIYEMLLTHFGKSRVGFYGDGKKQSDKLFTVGIGASLTRIEPDSKAWNDFAQCKVLIGDESHLLPASTLAKVCFGLAKNAQYRYFFSGTQMRGDGLDLLLAAITGPIVYRMSVKDGVDQGFLAKPNFRMCWTRSNVTCFDQDANELTRAHVYYNSELNKKAAEFANKAVSVMERPVLILVDEFEQVGQLTPHLRYEAAFAHGGVSKANKEKLDERFHNSDPKKLVEDFNNRKFPILIGTSCIATGTDIQAAGAIIYLRGGKSEVELRQSVGRGTRLVPGKKDCIVIDFGIENIELLKKHADARIKLYRDIYPSLQELRI